MPDVQYLFFHTAAADISNVDAAEIDRWHRKRGWSGIGYHYVIIDDRHDTLPDGHVEAGRPETKDGAHVLGVNSISLGVCCVGHGDKGGFTPKQKKSLTDLLAALARKYNVPVTRILGHREVNDLVDAGLVAEAYRTTKSCPGKKVDTNEIRSLVAEELRPREMLVAGDQPVPDSVKKALLTLAANEASFGNSIEEWRQFFYSGGIRSIVGNAE